MAIKLFVVYLCFCYYLAGAIVNDMSRDGQPYNALQQLGVILVAPVIMGPLFLLSAGLHLLYEWRLWQEPRLARRLDAADARVAELIRAEPATQGRLAWADDLQRAINKAARLRRRLDACRDARRGPVEPQDVVTEAAVIEAPQVVPTRHRSSC